MDFRQSRVTLEIDMLPLSALSDQALANVLSENSHFQEYDTQPQSVVLFGVSGDKRFFCVTGASEATGEMAKKVAVVWQEMIRREFPALTMSPVDVVDLNATFPSGVPAKVFTKCRTHEGVIAACGLIPDDDPLPSQLFRIQEFVRVDLDSAWFNLALDFDLYLHLPQNSKFLKLLKKGHPLNAEVKARLATDLQGRIFTKEAHLPGYFKQFCYLKLRSRLK